MRPLSLVIAATLSFFILPEAGWALPKIQIDAVTSGCTNNKPSITVTMESASWNNWKNDVLWYHNPPGTASTQQWPSNTNPATFTVPATVNPGKFQITNSPSASAPNRGITHSQVHDYTVATCGGAKKGMTWIHSKSDATTGTITVGCSGCDAYHGDTVCTEQRPLLCIYKPTPPFQLPKDLPNPKDNLWSGGVVATTEPVAGEKFKDIKEANSYCEDKFGKGWRVAEFHDGGTWNLQAYGGTVSAPAVPSTRFWVYIKNQIDGNCWK